MEKFNQVTNCTELFGKKMQGVFRYTAKGSEKFQEM